VPRSYILKEWAYPVLLFFFLFTFLALFVSSLGFSIFSFWQKALIWFISGASYSQIYKIILSISYFSLFILFLYLVKLEFFPTFLENITIFKDDIGKIKISQRAIWEVVERRLSEFPYVKKLKMYITEVEKRFYLHIHVDLVGDDSDLSDIENKAYNLAKEIRRYIFEGIGIEIAEVEIVIEGLKYNFREEESESG